MPDFKIHSPYQMAGDQPEAVAKLVEGINNGLTLSLIHISAALCIGGTAFAANAQSWFPLLFPNGGDANLEGYVQTADSAKLTDENEHYRLSVESVLFDESAGTGVISLHLANKKQDGVKPFTLAHLIDSYRNKPDITWSTLSSCYAEEGQLDFCLLYTSSEKETT